MFPAGAEPRPLESSRVERTNQEATLVPQGRALFWSAPKITTSGKVRDFPSLCACLEPSLTIWLAESKKRILCACSENCTFAIRDSWCWPKGARSLRTSMVWGLLIERLSLTLLGLTSNGKRQKWNFCRLSLALWTVEWKYLYLWQIVGEIFLFFCDLMKD